MEVKIEESWKKRLSSEFEKEYFKTLAQFVKEEYKKKKIYPEPKNIFRAFDLCPFEKVKVVIIGQDPYHGAGQAHGLCFSVQENFAIPPSLQNIYKELVDDLNCPEKLPNLMESGFLERWAKQGVLLLNATLTVEAGQAGSHQGKGWELFTDAVINVLAKEKAGLVFLLWGKYAEKKGTVIDRSKHLVLTAAHPSPFSAYSGFFGCKHFSKTNEWLKKEKAEEIKWI